MIDQDTDEITEEDMIAATSRFQKIRDASIASLVHDSSDTNKIQVRTASLHMPAVSCPEAANLWVWQAWLCALFM